MGEIARSKSRIASDLETRDSNRWRPCNLKLRFETRDWRFVLNTPIQQTCEKGCDLSPRTITGLRARRWHWLCGTRRWHWLCGARRWHWTRRGKGRGGDRGVCDPAHFLGTMMVAVFVSFPRSKIASDWRLAILPI